MTMVRCSVACISGLDGRATVKQLLDCQLHKPVAVFSLNCRSPRRNLLSLPGIMTEVTSTTSGNHNQSHVVEAKLAVAPTKLEKPVNC